MGAYHQTKNCLFLEQAVFIIPYHNQCYQYIYYLIAHPPGGSRADSKRPIEEGGEKKIYLTVTFSMGFIVFMSSTAILGFINSSYFSLIGENSPTVDVIKPKKG
jgi:hypothetical protein